MPPKSIFRQPGARHFQLVHRSQRDPLINDPEASDRVFKEVERLNAKKKDAGEELSEQEESTHLHHQPGEAALYGIYFDDRDYDYTQHLRKVGVEEQGVESIFLEAPSRQKRKPPKNAAFDLIPKEVLPSKDEMPITYESQEAIPTSISGFQPDMDPHLRQTLEALEDEAFVDEGLDEDFFNDLLGDGERSEGEDVEFEFEEDGLQEDDREQDDNWQARFAKFKLDQKKRVDDGSMLDGQSEGGDTLGRLPSLSVAGAKKRRRKGGSDASGYSMSSSSMFRNEGLTRLDEQFEKFEQEYASDEEQDGPDAESEADSDGSAPLLITTREDFEAVLDDFLAQELVGNKLKPKLEGDTPQEKLDTLRRTLADKSDTDALARREALLNREDKDDAPMIMPVDVDDRQERWDCETILSTYSNLENHPRLLRLTQPRGTKKIHLDPKSGLPTVKEAEAPKDSVSNDSDEETDEEETSGKITVTRPKNETAEEKKARKQAVKQGKQERRKEKKGNKELFSSERKHQAKVLSTREKPGVRKL